MLTPVLQRRLGLAKGSGATFFAGDEKLTRPRWALIVAWIDSLPLTGVSAAKVVGAAIAMFDAFAHWASVTREELPWSM